MTKKLILSVSIIFVLLTLSVFGGCYDPDAVGNWINFSSDGKYYEESFGEGSYRHTFINKATIGVTVRYLDSDICHIEVGDEGHTTEKTSSSLYCKVRADDDRDLEIVKVNTTVEFHDK